LLTFDGKGRRVSAGIHQPSKKDGHVGDFT
jgi:hypothetical protein